MSEEKDAELICVDGKIEGIEIVERKTHSDDRGDLTEIYRIDESYHANSGHPVRQVYLVEDPVRNTVRAFHKHKELWDFFTIIHGRAKFVLVDDRPDSKTYKNRMTIVTTAANKKLVIVPPGIHHGWQSLEDDTMLLSIASHTYYRDKPDEERINPYKYSEWEIDIK